MVRPTATLWVSDPSVPWTFRVFDPGAAVPPAIVKVEAPVGVTLAGFSEQVAPEGQPPSTLRDTGLLYPFSAAREIVLVPLAPGAMLTDAGLAEIEKSGFGRTASPP